MGMDDRLDLLTLTMVVARLTRVEADRRARQHGMTRAQWGILIHLERQPGLSQKEMADLLEVEPISVARLVDRLEKAGLVERRADMQDRRIWRLHLRSEAAPYLNEIDCQRREITEFVTAGLSDADKEAVLHALSRMKANLLRGPDAQPPPACEEEQENA